MKRNQICVGMKVLLTHPSFPGRSGEAEVTHIGPGSKIWIRLYKMDGKEIPFKEMPVSAARLKCYAWYKDVLPSNRLRTHIHSVTSIIAVRSKETGLSEYQSDHLLRLKEEERLLAAAIDILIKHKL
jgi:hypothetical protein